MGWKEQGVASPVYRRRFSDFFLGLDMKVKDLGSAWYLLGIELRRWQDFGDPGEGDILLVQEKYLRNMPVLYEMVGCKPASTSLEPNVKLTEEDCPVSDREKEELARFPYRSVMGSLMYLVVCTRPDTCQAVSELSRTNADPRRVHWEGATRVPRYLSGSAVVGLPYKGGESADLWNYVDARHASCPGTGRGELGMCSCRLVPQYQGAARDRNGHR